MNLLECGGQLLNLRSGTHSYLIVPNGWKASAGLVVHTSSINDEKEVGNPRPTGIRSTEKLRFVPFSCELRALVSKKTDGCPCVPARLSLIDWVLLAIAHFRSLFGQAILSVLQHSFQDLVDMKHS